MADELNRQRIQYLRERRELLLEQIEITNDVNEKTKYGNQLEEVNVELSRRINELLETRNTLSEQQFLQQERINRSTRTFKKIIADSGTALVSIGITTRSIFGTLMEIDGSIRRTTRSFGLAGGRADILRQNFEDTAGYAFRLGSSTEELQEASLAYANEIGRARVHSQATLKNIIDIGKGTGLGVTQASRLAAQYETIGIDARLTAQYTEGILESSERMGVSAANVLDAINKNFRRLQTFTFVRGVKSMGSMAAYAEKMRIDISEALDSAEIARNLEGAIGMAAQLQVMGGEFAKTDPFELLYLSRNDPEVFQEKISDLTKGVVTLRKTSDGTFEQFMSPADRDRLAGAAKALNMSKESMIEIARRSAEVSHIREQMRGMGLSSQEREIIEGITRFDSNLNRFVIKVGGVKKDISDLTRTQLRGFAEHSKSLEERAMAAQTFDEAFRQTTEELKTVFLPVLKGINDVLVTVRPVVISFNEILSNMSDTTKSLLGGAGKLIIAAKALTIAAKMLGGGFLVRKLTTWMSPLNWGKKTPSPLDMGGETTTRGVSDRTRRGGAVRRGAGMGMLRGGAGIGAAGLGMGAGIGAAAFGIGQLAESMSQLNIDQLKSLERIMIGIGIAGVGLPPIILAIGKSATISSPGLLALGGAMLMIGAGVGVAVYGISRLAESINDLSTGQLIALPATMLTLAASFWALTPAITAVSAAGTAGAGGLIAVGGAALMMGAGVMLATTGIAKLGTSINELSAGQLIALPAIVLSLAASFWTLTPAIGAVSAAGTAGAGGLLALGAASLMMGGGVMLATTGIAKLGASINELSTGQLIALPAIVLSLAASFWTLTPAIGAVGAAGTAGAGGLIAVGGAALMMGAGVMLATTGIAKLGASINELSTGQLIALPATMLTLAASFWALTPAIAAVGTAGAVGSGGLIAVGLAALMMGSGIMLATSGIAKLAESINDLSTGQLIALPATMLTLAASFWALTPAITAVATAGIVGAGGLMVLGASVTMIGAGMYLLGKGINFTTSGISQMIATADDGKDSLTNIASGVSGLAVSLMGFGKAALPGMLALRSTLNHIARRSNELNNVGHAFREINAVLSGSADDFERIKEMITAISNLEVKDKSVFGEIAKLLDKPLKVEFTDKEVAIVSNITLNIEGERIIERIGARKMAQITESARTQGLFS